MAGEEGVHRLTDFVVEEVSLVDRAANKRRFLVVKREGGEMSELRSNGRGGFTRVTKADDDEEEKRAAKAAADAEEEEKRKAAEKAKKPAFPGAAKPFGAGGEPSDDEKEKAAKAAADEEEENEKARKVLEAAGLTGAAKRIGKANPQGMALANQVAKLAEDLAKVASDLKDEEADEPSDVHMKKLVASHKKMGAMCDKYMAKVGKSAVAKIGAKMSAARLESFKAGLGTLQGILAELMETAGSANEHAADAGDPTKAPGGFKANNPSDAPTNAMGSAAIKALEKSFEAQLSKLMTDVVEPLATLAKAQGTELAKLKKSVVPSNSIPVEKRNNGRAASVAWPMDMARTGGGNVNKSESFLDD